MELVGLIESGAEKHDAAAFAANRNDRDGALRLHQPGEWFS